MINISITTRKLKRSARKTLFNVYPILLLSTLFFITLNIGFNYLSASFASLLYGYTEDSAVNLIAFTFMVISAVLCAPLFYGYARIAITVCRDKEAVLSDLFYFYSSKENAVKAYACALKSFPSYFAGIALPIFFYNGATEFLKSFTGENGSVISFVQISVLSAAILGITVLLCVLGFFITGISVKHIFATASGSEYTIRGRNKEFFLLRLSFIPLLIISVLSFGILFIVYTVPMLAVSYGLCLCFEDTAKENGVSLDEEAEDEIDTVPSSTFYGNYDTNDTGDIVYTSQMEEVKGDTTVFPRIQEGGNDTLS